MIKLKQQLTYLTALLSSSCCIIQLVLNYFSISCAGFTIFTPYRPFFTSITVMLLTWNVLYHYNHKNKTRLLFSVVFSVMLMLSPEIIQYINQHSSLLLPIAKESATYYYRIQLDGLGCEACANRIKNTLNSIDLISNSRVYFHNQTAIIETMKKLENYSIVENLIKSIDIKKYDAQVLNSWAFL